MIKPENSKTLTCYSNILDNFDKLKDCNILTNERIDQINSFIAPDKFIPPTLQNGRVLKDWLLHAPTDRMYNKEMVEKRNYYILSLIISEFLTQEEIDAINKHANSIYCTKNEQIKFEKAEKIPENEWSGPVYSEGLGYYDGYFSSIEDLHDDVADSIENEAEDFGNTKINYVWACDSIPTCQLNLDNILERETEEAHENFDIDDLKGQEELAAAIDKFNELNKDFVSYQPNFKKAIILNKAND